MSVTSDVITPREYVDLRDEVRTLTVTMRDELRALDKSVRDATNRTEDQVRALTREMHLGHERMLQTTGEHSERVRDKVDTTLRWLIGASLVFGFGLITVVGLILRIPH